MNNLLKKLFPVFYPKTLREIVELELRKAMREKAESEKVILDHSFQKHMSEASILAMRDWLNKYPKQEEVIITDRFTI